MKNWMQDRKLINTVSLALVLATAVVVGVLIHLAVISGILVPLIALGAALAMASSIRIADQWEKAVVLRMGKFRRLRGPGPFLVIPVIDRVYKYIDQRVRVTDFQAEKALTKDTVPVNVDAVVYWMVWDAEKAALEVCQYKEAVAYLAQTGLRDTIGRHELADLLQNREKIAATLQESLDEYTNPWGITCQHVGIKDIIIPVNLANAMSKRAQAERERQARVILGTAETEIAEKFALASREYINNPVALQLRGMNMLYEGLKEKGSLVIVPSSALETMNLGAISGLTALTRSTATQAEPDKAAAGPERERPEPE